jgi:hypothetical protein
VDGRCLISDTQLCPLGALAAVTKPAAELLPNDRGAGLRTPGGKWSCRSIAKREDGQRHRARVGTNAGRRRFALSGFGVCIDLSAQRLVAERIAAFRH